MAVWEGQRPADDDEAGEIFGELAERFLEEDGQPASPRITRFVAALVSRWGDLDGTGDAPWASGGTGDASGPVLHLHLRPDDDRLAEVAAAVADLATAHDLVCFDLQEGSLRP